MDGWMIMIAFLAKLPLTTNNSCILQRLIGKLNNNKINHLHNLQIQIQVNKQCHITVTVNPLSTSAISFDSYTCVSIRLICRGMEYQYGRELSIL